MQERKLIFPTCDYVFDTHTETQNEFIEKTRNFGIDASVNWLKTFKNSELSYPKSLTFKWEGAKGDLFEISESADFLNPYSVSAGKPSVEISNLKTGTKYYWRINRGKSNYFHTSDNKFRFIKIDGLLNVRDIGGINIKQGLIYRGSHIDIVYKITEEGKVAFCDQLKIKTQLDLCGDDDKDISSAGDNIALKHFSYRPYMESFEQEHKAMLKNIFDFLSDAGNYPVYIHCLGGADRTGMIALFLRAIAGECEDDIFLDYELTSLSTYGYGLAEGATADGFRKHTCDYFTEFLEALSKYAPGKSFSEKVKAFLYDCKISDNCIKKVLNIIKKK